MLVLYFEIWKYFVLLGLSTKLIYTGLVLEFLADQMLLNGMCMNARNNKNMQFNQNVAKIQTDDDFGSEDPKFQNSSFYAVAHSYPPLPIQSM